MDGLKSYINRKLCRWTLEYIILYVNGLLHKIYSSAPTHGCKDMCVFGRPCAFIQSSLLDGGAEPSNTLPNPNPFHSVHTEQG